MGMGFGGGGGTGGGATLGANTFTDAQAIALASANATALTVSGYSLTGSNAQSLISLAGTWNTTGTPSALLLNITDTASNASSLLMDLQVGGTSRFSVRKDGRATVVAGAYGTPSISFGTTNGYLFGNASTFSFIESSGTTGFQVGGGQLYIAGDVVLNRVAADTLELRRTTNAQTFRVYNTFTDASNYERFQISFSAGICTLGAANAGTGGALTIDVNATNNLRLCTNGTARFVVSNSTGHMIANADNTYDFGGSSNRARDVYCARDLYRPGGTQAVFRTSAAITSGAGAGAGTLTNAPAAGNPTCWIPINDNGTTRYIPAW